MKKYILIPVTILGVLFSIISCGTPKSNVGEKAAFTSNSIADILKYPYPVKTLNLVSGIDISYNEEGKSKATPVLFIHGEGSYMRVWDRSFTTLSRNYRCIRLDLPGYGKSSKGNYQGGMKFYADAVKEFCDRMKIKKVSIIGHSMGGQIAMTTALLYPNLVEKIVLIAPTGFVDFNFDQKATLKAVSTMATNKAATDAEIKKNFESFFYKMPPDARFMADDRLKIRTATDFEEHCNAVSQDISATTDGNVLANLANIKQPALCIFGKNDGVVPNKTTHPTLNTEGVAKAATKSMGKCDLLMMNEAGHFVVWEKAWMINDKIRAFLK